jgi:hypothetical protein
MTLSEKSIQSLKNKSQTAIWNYVTALHQLQNALFELEKEEKDPEILQDLATRALEIGKEIESILDFMEKNAED